MHRTLKLLPAGIVGLGLLAPAAHAEDQVVANPGPGVQALAVSDQVQPGRVVVRATTPVAVGHVSTLLIDAGGDGRADLAVLATRTASGTTVRATSVAGSTTTCQQFGGTTASPVIGATGSVAADGSGWTASLPAAGLGSALDWKVTAVAPGPDDLCGGTDGAVLGLATSLEDAHRFRTGTAIPEADTTAPAAPAALTGVAGDGRVDLDWADGTEPDLAGYRVYRRAGAGPFVLLASPATSALGDVAVENGTAYTYYVKAADAAGNLSDESVKLALTPQAAPVITPPPGTPDAPGPGIAEPVVPIRTPTPPASAPVAPRPAGTTRLATVGGAQLLSSRKAADRPRFDARTWRATFGLLYNGATVRSTVRVRYTVRVRIPATRRKRAHVATVTVGSSTTTLQPGATQRLTFRLNAAGRRLAASRSRLDVRAAVSVTPKGGARRTGTARVVLTRKARG